jgi:hypothetical protein
LNGRKAKPAAKQVKTKVAPSKAVKRAPKVELLDLDTIQVEPSVEVLTSAESQPCPDENRVDYPKGVKYEERVVAFVDVLGFKEIIARSVSDPELVHRIFYALDVRKDDWATMYAADVGLQRKPEEFTDRFHSFSDCVVMSVGTKIEDIGLLVYGIFKLCRQLLVQGFASRGGIAKGLLYHHDEVQAVAGSNRAPTMVFGPAFIDAYQFESSHADGPRVILQNKVWQQINSYCSENPSEKLAKFLSTHIQRAEDGPAFIDLFADFGLSHFYDTNRDLSAEMKQIQTHICQALDSSTDRPLHFKKNAQLAREFNKAVERANQVEFRIPKSKLPARD